jgi:hypothetical protein
MRLTIAVLSREYPPDTLDGGIAPASRMEAEALAGPGHVVHVLSLAPDGRTRSTPQTG